MCVSINVDGFTIPNQSRAFNRRPVVECLGTEAILDKGEARRGSGVSSRFTVVAVCTERARAVWTCLIIHSIGNFGKHLQCHDAVAGAGGSTVNDPLPKAGIFPIDVTASRSHL